MFMLIRTVSPSFIIDKNIDPMTGTFNDIKPGMNYVMKGYIEADEYKSK